MIDRHQARILAMQALCQFDVLQEDFERELVPFLSDESPPAGVLSYATSVARNARANLETIDELIESAAENWELKRMAPVDRNTLRVAVCELLYQEKTPSRVLVNEAIEISRAFGTAESAGFINGVLDAVVKNHEGSCATDAPAPPTDSGSPEEASSSQCP